MEPTTVQFVIEACAGRLHGPQPPEKILRLITDSRQAQAGDLFLALPGENFDGHDFVQDIFRRGAGADAFAGRGKWRGLGMVHVLVELYFPEAERIAVVLNNLHTHTLAGQALFLTLLLPRERGDSRRRGTTATKESDTREVASYGGADARRRDARASDSARERSS